MRFLLDTDHISILQRRSKPHHESLMARLAQHAPTDVAFSIISFHEQVLGCHTYIGRARNSGDLVRGYGMLAQVLRAFQVAPVLPFDEVAAGVFHNLVARRLRTATMDLRIASIALSRGMHLVTRNARDFQRVTELQIEDWTS